MELNAAVLAQEGCLAVILREYLHPTCRLYPLAVILREYLHPTCRLYPLAVILREYLHPTCRTCPLAVTLRKHLHPTCRLYPLTGTPRKYLHPNMQSMTALWLPSEGTCPPYAKYHCFAAILNRHVHPTPKTLQSCCILHIVLAPTRKRH